MKINRNKVALILGTLILIGAVFIGGRALVKPKSKITNFSQCVRAGYPVAESFPEVCRTPDGRNFVNSAAVGGDSSPGKTNLTFETMVSGDNKGQGAPSRSVIRDGGVWATLWNDLHSHIEPRPELLEVDFTKEMVVYVLMGRQTNAGFSTKIQNVVLEDGRITVHYLEVSPGPGCLVAQALSNPYHIIRLKKSDQPVEFSLEKQTKNCKG